MDKVTRRMFIGAGIGVVVILGLSLLDGLRVPILSEREKKRIIAEELKTPRGREMLAKAMVEPRRCPGLQYVNTNDIQPLRIRGEFD